jgi:FtsP/CotA-like multicopper oxidase with cupredoxin domain
VDPVRRIIAAVKRTRPLAVSVVVGLVAAASGCHRSPEERVLREFAGAYPVAARPNGAVREFEITAAEAELPQFEQSAGSAPQPGLPPGDGGKLRVLAYNGQVPGPTIRIRLGDRLRVHFTNRLSQPTTIHWHGVRVPNGMDGVPHLTQPPVEPGGSFVYEFTPKDAGTFWFHPHVHSSQQVERGLYGVLIVEDEHPAPYDQDVVWVLDDWLLDAPWCATSAIGRPSNSTAFTISAYSGLRSGRTVPMQVQRFWRNSGSKDGSASLASRARASFSVPARL